MRSRTANVLLLLVGLFFAGTGIDLYAHWISTGLNVVDGHALTFGTIYLCLSGWCLFCSIGNLRKLRAIRQDPVRLSESLIRWHLRALAAAVGCELVAALLYWRWQIITLGGFRIVHWIMITTFAVIPLTVIGAMTLRERENRRQSP